MKKKHFGRNIALVGIAALVYGLASAQTPAAPELKNVLSRLDTASRNFKSATADLEWDNYQRVVRDTSKQFGSIYFQRKDSTSQMGAVLLDPGTKARQKVLEYKDGQLRMFDLGVDQITVIKAGANQSQYESFLTLGFGGSGTDLVHAWDITSLPAETSSEGCATPHTEKLQLISKEANVRNTFTRVTLWIDADRSVSLKQVFETPSGDKRTACYSNIKLNEKLDANTFAIKPDKKTTTINH